MSRKKYPRLIKDPYALRLKSRLSQRDFWGTIGVTQSGGGIYEKGRQMPRYLEILFQVVYMGREVPKPPKYRADGTRLFGPIDRRNK